MLADNRRRAVFLRPYAFARLFNGRALVGRASALPVPTFRSANPALCPLTPFSSGQRAFDTNVGGRTMLHHIPARPEQTQSPLEIIRAALREAATAPTVYDALDVTGDALRRLAEIARAEVSHG